VTTPRLGHHALAAAIGAALFVAVAWPLLLLDVPPYQDLPGHLATVQILAHPERYPDIVSNGFFKTNAAFIAFTFFVGKLVGIKAAARLFCAVTLAALAFALPRFVLELGGGGEAGRRKMVVASLFFLPMVHCWWVSMGMLNFALGLALALETLVRLERQRRAPSAGRAAAAALFAVLTWYAHNLPLLVVGLLVVVHVLLRPSWKERIAAARTLVGPLVPVALLMAAVTAVNVFNPGKYLHIGDESFSWEAPVWILYDLWARFFYGFTPLSATSLVLAAALAALALRRAREDVPFFSPLAWALPLLFVVFVPYMLPTWGYVNVRFIPFVWFGALVRVPERLPRALAVGLAAAAALYAAGMAVDLFRLERDQREFLAGALAVPEGARLLTLNFDPRPTSKNTWSLQNASGLYVVERFTSPQDVWAHSSQMPIVYREDPGYYGDWSKIRRFVSTMATKSGYCARDAADGLPAGGCEDEWRAKWAAFWSGATPRFDHVLLWSAPADVDETIPAAYRETFRAGRLRVLERVTATPSP
jgi:hypothetical protein